MYQFTVALAAAAALWRPLLAPPRANPPSARRIAVSRSRIADTHDIIGTVSDSASGKPLPAADVVARRSGSIVTRASTDALGHYTLHNIPNGAYDLEARYIGFRASIRQVQVAGTDHDITVGFRMVPAPIQLQDIEVSAGLPVALDTRTGDQVFKQNDYHGAPTNTTSQILQQSIAGSARAPTGEVHIRGQHAEYTYYVDGIPVPAGISGSLNELFDPSVVNQINFQTGSWDAEYGNKNAAIINVTTRVPAGGFHLDASGYGGSFKAAGQTVSASTNAGKFGFFVSGSRSVSDMRREPVVANVDTTTNRVLDLVNIHNHGEDLFTFGKAQYVPSGNDVINLVGNWSRTRFGVPYDTTGGVFLDDNQQDINSFINLGWTHRTGSGSNLFLGGFHRNGSLNYTPGLTDTPQFIFFPDTLTPYNLRENRNFSTTGIKADYEVHPSEKVQFKFGALASVTRGHEDFSTVDGQGGAGPASNSDLRGSDVGVYAQTVIAPSEKWEVRGGARYDNHDAPFAPHAHQVSPRIRLSLFPDAANTIWFYYGRLFLPTNVEDLRAITSVAQQGVTTDPTLPERDDFFEVGYVHRFRGLVLKFAAYQKSSSPGIDDNTVPGSAITTSVNIAQVKITGIESVIEVRPGGPLSGYLNVALNHAYGRGPITGGFFPTDEPPGYFDLDHDQRLSAVANLNYSAGRLFLSATGTYGSGLTNGIDPDPATYGTGLFRFNRSIKVDPSLVVNASAGYTVSVSRALVIRPQLYVDNLFNKKYLLKGAFFSGASYGRPRSVQLRLALGF